MDLPSILPLTTAGIAAPAWSQVFDPPSKPPFDLAAQTALIEEVRINALDYSARLPNFLCTQRTRRYSASVHDREPIWKLLDALTIHVSYFGQRENYQVVQVNGKPVDKSFRQISGYKVTGDLGSILRNVFRSGSRAKFHWSAESVWNGRPAAVFSYRIEQANSSFGSTHMSRTLGLVPNRSRMNWAAKGLVYADMETRQVYRLTVESVNIAPNFPIQDIRVAIDYANRKVGDREYLLPVRSLSSTVASGKISKGDSEFSDYRKFSAEAAISFGTNVDEAPVKKQ